MEAKLKVKLLEHTPNPDRLVAKAAKLCYSQVGIDEIDKKITDDEVAKFVNHLVKIGHESPIEHVAFTFGIEGISRSCSHQIVRHRIASFSQQSQRYVKLDEFEYIVPPAIAEDEKLREFYVNQMKASQEAYDILVDSLMDKIFFKEYRHLLEGYKQDLIDHEDEYHYGTTELDLLKEHKPKIYSKIEKQAIEDARYVFPNACETKMVFTMNARSLHNFFAHRCCNRAQWEIRELANQMLSLVREVAPILFKYAGAPCEHGSCPEGSMSCGKPILRESEENK